MHAIAKKEIKSFLFIIVIFVDLILAKHSENGPDDNYPDDNIDNTKGDSEPQGRFFYKGDKIHFFFVVCMIFTPKLHLHTYIKCEKFYIGVYFSRIGCEN
jgi:hypothetical protein